MLDRAVPPGETPDEGPSAGAEEGRPVVRLTNGGLAEAVAAAAAVLGRATLSRPFVGYYRRGTELVRTVRLADEAELGRDHVRRARGSLQIRQADPDALRVALARAAVWQRPDDGRGWVATDVPVHVTKALIATAADWPTIPILTGIVEAPTLRSDGTVLDRPGYDPRSGLLFDPGGLEFRSVPDKPTREEASAKLDLLRSLVKDFPFADAASESVALSGIIAPLVRPACRAVPLHAITAPKPGSGKTLLARLPGYIATGRVPATVSQADGPAEEQKRLLAVLMEGQGVVVIDNIERDLRSDTLCTVLTEPEFSGRLLGQNRTAQAPNRATFFANGNNLTVAGDLTARAVICVLDPACERPEEREFEVDLPKVVPERRAELAVAALTVVRAYLAHIEAGGGRVRLPNFARFEDWSRLVREALVWLGMADPCANREHIEGHDPVRARLGPLLAAWYEAFRGEPVTVAEAISWAAPDQSYKGPATQAEKRRRLHEAMIDVAAGRGGVGVDPRSLGHFVRRYEQRREGGLRFERVGKLHNVVQWRVVADESHTGDKTGGIVPKPLS